MFYPDGTIIGGSGSVSGLAYPAGVTQVTYKVTDAGGLKDSCSFTVTIKNIIAPTLSVICPTGAAKNITQPVDIGKCTADVSVPAPIISNPCNEVYSMVNDFNGTNDASGTYPFGPTTVTWTITDASGNITNCRQTVTVTGTTPSLTCPADISGFADFMQPYKDIVVVPPPTYNVTCGVPIVTWAMTYPSGDPRPNPVSAATGINLVTSPSRFYVGVTTISYTVADINGNSINCSFTVTILAKPDISCLGPVSYVADPGKCWHTVQQADADNPGVPMLVDGSQPIDWTWTITNPDASTATGGSTTTTLSPIPANIGPYNFQRGVSTIKWHAQNPSGFSECTQTVTVTENEPPTYTLPSALDKCVLSIQNAQYDKTNSENFTPTRPEYYLFMVGNTELDLSNLADNCCAVSTLIIHWRIDFSGGGSLSGTGQPSTYGTDIVLPGDGVTNNNVFHTISYWIEDCESQLYPEQQVNITIRPRPNLIKMP